MSSTMPQTQPGGIYPLADHETATELTELTRGGPAGPVAQKQAGRAPAIFTGPGEQQRPRSRRLLRWTLVLLLLAAAATTLRLTVLAPKPIPVDVVRVGYGAVEETVSNTRAGTVKARLRAGLSPETAGRVVALPHREGDRVKRGALLLRLDDAIPRANLAVAVEDVAVAEAHAQEACLAAELAANELSRFSELRRRGIASEQTLDSLTSERDRSAAACRAGNAALGQAQARTQLVRAQLDLTEIRAPFDGIVAEISTELGEWITPSPTGISLPAVVDLLDPSSFYITAPIDEMDAARVQPGQEVRVTVDTHRGQSFTGHLARVAPYVLDLVEQNRTVEVEAELDDPEVVATLLAGTSADVEVIISRSEHVLQIPTTAIAEGDKVLVVEGDRLHERSITTGLSNWSTTEVVAGLDEGEQVVVSRDSKEVKDGAIVVAREAS